MALWDWLRDVIGDDGGSERECIEKDFYYQLLDLSRDAIAFYTAGTGIVGANSRFLKLFEIEDLDTLTREYPSLHNLFDDEDESILCENDTVWFDYIRKSHPQGYGVRFIDKHEQIHHLLLHVEQIEHNKTYLYYVTFKQAEEIYALQARLMESESATKAFLSDVGMQFRTPMQGILGFVKLLENSDLNVTQNSYLKQVALSARELVANIENLLTTAEMEHEPGSSIASGSFHPQIEIENLLGSFAHRALEHHVSMYSDVDPSLPQTLLGDIKRLKQLLFGVVNYALQVAHGRSELTLSLRVIARPSVDQIRVRFGMLVTRTIADPHRDDMTLIRKLVSLLGGELELKNSDAGSAAIAFELPFGIARQNIPVIQSHSGHYRALVVEDNSINQNLMRLMLEGYGIEVALANNGEEAVAHAKRSDFDIIMMDIDMPVMNGIEATREIKKMQHESNRHTPIVAVTALAMQGDEARLLKAGLDDYLAKPLTREMLEFILKKYLKLGCD